LNADGFDDLIVADPNNSSNTGRAWIVFGGTSLGSTISLGSIGTGGFRVDGLPGNDKLGTALATGDFNGDGIDDIVLGAPNGDNTASNAGELYVIFGGPNVRTGFSFDLATLNGTNGFVINGAAQDNFAGSSVSSAGDFNGDGFDDIVIGAYGYNSEGSGVSGSAVVLFGKSTFGASVNLSSVGTSDGIVLNQNNLVSPDITGAAVAGGGDIDGDGFDDVIVGALGSYGTADQNGKTYVVFGGEFGATVTNLGTSGNDTFSGTTARQVMVGGRGNDTLTGGGGQDTLLGGIGDDILGISDTTFRRLDGGAGNNDVFRIDGNNLALDFTAIADGKIRGIERIDATGAGNNALTLKVSDVLHFSDTSNALRLLGNSGDTVTIDFQGKQVTQSTTTIDGTTFTQYTGASGLDMSLLIDQDFAITATNLGIGGQLN